MIETTIGRYGYIDGAIGSGGRVALECGGAVYIVERPEVLVVGYAVRTTNAAEGDPSRAMLPGLWARAGAPGAFAHVPGRVDENLYAVLTDYESDHQGAYTQIVGVAIRTAAGLPEGMVAVRVPGVQSLTIEAHGPMPQALIEAWQQVWRHTESGGIPPRAYTTDLEVHHAAGVDLYLAVLPAPAGQGRDRVQA